MRLWNMLADLAPYQHAAAIILRLGGAGKQLVRTLTPNWIAHGAMAAGIQVGPISPSPCMDFTRDSRLLGKTRE